MEARVREHPCRVPHISTPAASTSSGSEQSSAMPGPRVHPGRRLQNCSRRTQPRHACSFALCTVVLCTAPTQARPGRRLHADVHLLHCACAQLHAHTCKRLATTVEEDTSNRTMQAEVKERLDRSITDQVGGQGGDGVCMGGGGGVSATGVAHRACEMASVVSYSVGCSTLVVRLVTGPGQFMVNLAPTCCCWCCHAASRQRQAGAQPRRAAAPV